MRARDEPPSVPVFASAGGRLCRACGRPVGECACRRAEPPAAGGGVVRVARETRGRRGRGVTVVTGVPLAGEELARLGAELRRLCGSGGTVRGGAIEVQGEHRDRLVAELERRGYRVRRAGA